MTCGIGRGGAALLLGALALADAGGLAAQPIRQEVFEQVTVTGDARCARVGIELAVPFAVLGHLPDAPTRYFYLFVRVAAPGGAPGAAPRGRESAAYPRKATPWLENVGFIGDVPGLQLLTVELSQTLAVQPLPQRDARAAALMIATPGNEQACRAQVESRLQP